MTHLEIKRKANDYLHKGRYHEAIAEYERLLEQMKKPNPAILNLIGDLHIKQGSFEKGFEAYLHASRVYADEGLFHNGIAVGKKVLRMDADQTEVYGMLGQLYARQGLGMDCVKFLGEYARRKEEESEYPAALASFAEACEILPEFPDVHGTYGEMLAHVDRNDDAATAYDNAAAACADREMHAEAAQWQQRARVARGEEAGEETGDVNELMNLRTLEDSTSATPQVKQVKADPWAAFDPSTNPDIPPPPPLPGAAPVAAKPAPPPPIEEVEAPAGLGPDGTFEIEIEAPVAEESAAGPEADGEVDIDVAHEEAVRDVAPAEQAPAAANGEEAQMDDFFESGAAEAAASESEPAVIVGDDFELVREGGDVQEVINDFREATMDLLDLEDHQAHYDLGTTYMEMELFDEAAAEFEISARGTDFVLPSQEMLGYCFLRKGNIDLAVRELKKGLEVEGYDDRDKLGLLYNLGVACRVLDQENEAIEYFRRILEIEPDFRDTKTRLDRLVENSA